MNSAPAAARVFDRPSDGRRTVDRCVKPLWREQYIAAWISTPGYKGGVYAAPSRVVLLLLLLHSQTFLFPQFC